MCGVSPAPQKPHFIIRGFRPTLPHVTCIFIYLFILFNSITLKQHHSWTICSSICHCLAAKSASRKEMGRSRGQNSCPLCVL